MKPGDKVYSPQLAGIFTVKEIKGNAIVTEEGATLSSKMIVKQSNVNDVFMSLYQKDQRESSIQQLAEMTKIDGGQMLHSMVQDHGMPLTTFLEILKRT